MGMTIQDLRVALAQYPADWIVRFGPLPLEWDGVSSYRGYYDQPSCMDDLVRLTRHSWTGYKGGEYRYHEDQELHVARYGETTSCFIGSVTSPFEGYVTLVVVSEDGD